MTSRLKSQLWARLFSGLSHQLETQLGGPVYRRLDGQLVDQLGDLWYQVRDRLESLILSQQTPRDSF